MPELFETDASGATWLPFNEVLEVPTRNGGVMYLFRQFEQGYICRMDSRFSEWLKPEIEALERQEEILLATIADDRRMDVTKERRISLNFYEERSKRGHFELYHVKNASKEPLQSFQAVVEPTQISKGSKSVTFEIPSNEHAFMHNLHKKVKHQEGLGTFGAFCAHEFSTAIRSLRIQHPDLWVD